MVPAATTPEQSLLTLVDGHGFLHRAFYASSRAKPALKGDVDLGSVDVAGISGFLFAGSLLHIRQTLPSSHFAVILDSKCELERKKRFPEYKRHRGAYPAELTAQIVLAEELCEVVGMPWRRSEGYEADDLIATYAREVKDCRVQIVSVDKDLLQLVDDSTTVHNPKRLEASVDRHVVMDKWGVWPEQMGDLLALMGDAADGIPGVPGIGRKRAAALLRRHGCLEGLFAALRREGRAAVVDLHGIGPKLTERLMAHETQVWSMRAIVELQTVPGVDTSAFKDDFRPYSSLSDVPARLVDYCRRKGYQGIAERIEAAAEAPAPAEAPEGRGPPPWSLLREPQPMTAT